MLEGLEINIRKKSEAFNIFYKSRIDPEFFQKKYIALEKQVNKKDFNILGEIAFVTDGEHGTAKTFETGYSKYFGARNVLAGILNDNNVDFISKKHHEKLKKTALNPRDVLISCVGANIGYSAIVPDNIGVGNIVRNVALIRSTSSYLNEYLHAYFLSKYGKQLYYRMNSGNAQPLVSLDYINTISIFKPSSTFQNFIKKVIDKSLFSIDNSKISYNKAENILLQEIGLQDFITSTEPVNVKSFKDSFATSGRLDAEYYQLKYEEVVDKVKNKNFDTLNNLVDINKSIEPGSKNYVENGLPFMRVADLSKNGLSEPQKYISEYFVKENQDKIKKIKPKKGTILFSKDGSVGIAYHLRQNYNGITSGAILHLNVKDESQIIPEYLTLALNSKVVQMQAERDAGGSIILHWRVGEIENVVVPIIDFDKQQEIADLIEQSFSLKKQSEHLLEVAKRAVEIAIEKSEEDAIKYIKTETNE